ncbi:cell wall-binding repeat-containing protein [Bacillus sp. EB106-08-02-XG196]|uniref:cell wall-binding repeat-containing protein n=1 Tax=Bacillus sp. EB106-08-02-XG196 TaxID=2737049 RepID=UPI0015C4BF64|nr:cell wall-binding repeat-containing protein [Bacillus sp. EB106-08-02-XG196]
MKRYFVVFSLVFTLVFMSLPSLVGHAEVTSKRMDGADRFAVSVNVSKEGWPNGSGTVILANYLAFADALAASPLAFKEDAPILLTHSNSITQTTMDEISRLKASRVLLVGGPGSISENIVSQLKQKGIQTIERIGGIDRYEVSFNIAQKLGQTDTAVLANGLKFPDALAIAPYAAQNGYPILLSQDNSLPSKTTEAFQTKGITKTIIVGGEGSVSANVASKVPNVNRIGGKDRYEVSANIVTQLNLAANKAFLATGMTFADALTGSVLAAKQNAPMLLMHPTTVPTAIQSLVQTKNIQDFVILGGTASVPERVFQILTGQAPALPLEGKTIVIDPGHGGTDPGAVQNGYVEKNLNNQFSLKFADKLQKLGANIIYTRNPNSDNFIDLPERASFANTTNADLFVSIHHDSNVSTSPSGFSIHYSSYRPAIEVNDVYVLSNGVKYPFIREETENKQFIVRNGSTEMALSYVGNNIAYDPTPSPAVVTTKALTDVFVTALAYPGIKATTAYSSTGIRDSNLYVTRWTNMPSILIELGFMSNSNEVKLLANPTVQDTRAQNLANSIKDYFNK